MIITVTMNPAIDKTVEIDEFVTGELNRIQKVEYDVGGKGINVSKTIRELGGESIATGFLGGNTGKTMEAVLKDKGIACDFVCVEGETRTNTKIFELSGAVTELNEQGPVISADQVEQLLQKLDGYANEDTLFILAGSIPGSVDQDIYARIIRMVHKKGSRVLLDADGELLRRSVLAKPDMMKPNRAELEEYAGFDYRASMEELRQQARKLVQQGVETVVVSLGQGGALFVCGGYEAECPALAVKAHSTVGAGDAMVAAMAYAWERRMEHEEMVRLSIAASAGAVTTIGTKAPERALVEELMKQVVIEK